MPKYFDGLGNDRTHYVLTLEEKAEKTDELETAIKILKDELKAVRAENTRLKKKKENE